MLSFCCLQSSLLTRPLPPPSILCHLSVLTTGRPQHPGLPRRPRGTRRKGSGQQGCVLCIRPLLPPSTPPPRAPSSSVFVSPLCWASSHASPHGVRGPPSARADAAAPRGLRCRGGNPSLPPLTAVPCRPPRCAAGGAAGVGRRVGPGRPGLRAVRSRLPCQEARGRSPEDRREGAEGRGACSRADEGRPRPRCSGWQARNDAGGPVDEPSRYASHLFRLFCPFTIFPHPCSPGSPSPSPC